MATNILEQGSDGKELLRLKPRALDISPDDPFREDALDRKYLVDSLSQVLASTNGPFVLSVSGGWGTGKTTFVKLLEQHLIAQGHQCAYLSAWETDFAADPLPAIVCSLRELSTEGTAKNALRKASELATIVSRRALPAVTKIATCGVLDLNEIYESVIADTVSGSIGDVVDMFSTEKKAIEQLREELLKFTTSLKTENEGARAIIFLDDLDRCRPTYAIEVLERIKHVFNVENLLFVVSLDRKQLGISLGAVYGTGIDSEEYVRRFIDLDFELPALSGEQFAKSLFDRFDAEQYFEARRLPEQSDDKKNLLSSFAELSALLGTSLRTQEQIFARIVVALKCLSPKHRIFPVPLVALSFLREVRIDLYRGFIDGSLEPLEIISSLKEYPNSKAFLNTFPGLVTIALLIRCSNHEKGREEAYTVLSHACQGEAEALMALGASDERIGDVKQILKYSYIVPDQHCTFLTDMIDLTGKFS